MKNKEFVYRTNDWKEVIDMVDRFWHEQSRAKSKGDRRESNKE